MPFDTLRYMKTSRYRKLKAAFLTSSRQVWRRRAFWLRMAVAWAIGMIFVAFNTDANLDLRLQARGPQETVNNIVVVEISRTEWVRYLGQRVNQLRPLKELTQQADSFFWQAEGWKKLLSGILSDHPKAVAVSLYFGENILPPPYSIQSDPVFTDRRVLWSTQLNQEGRVMPSRFARTYGHNAGLNEISADRDGTVRRTSFHTDTLPHLSLQMLKAMGIQAGFASEVDPRVSKLINFRGPRDTFPSLNFTDVVKHRYPKDFFHNKLVIVGGTGVTGQDLITPVGKMSRAEVYANIVDNLEAHRWVMRPGLGVMALLLALLVVFASWITSRYPQLLAFLVLSVVQMILMAGSVVLFDLFYVYIPILPCAVTLLAAYMIFLSFQLTVRDYENIRLENEREFLLNVEELKNNFLSLISHDLKTPIAKIHGICDRLLAQTTDDKLFTDLIALREEATELNRYIKTLLQTSKVESRDFRINKESSDINEIIETVCEQLSRLAQTKAVHLNLQLEPMFLIEVDTVLMHEVVLNVVENAIKYSPDGAEVVVTSREVDGQVIVMVEDKGAGIPQEEQAHVFEKFYRGEMGKHQSKGSGLGLYLVKYFIEKHGGKVLLESEFGKGTKIGFSLPINDGEATEAITPEPAGELHDAQLT